MKITYETLNILFLLMPGFFSAKLLDLILKRNNKDLFMQIIEALIFCVAIFITIELLFAWEPLLRVESINGTLKYQCSSNKKIIICTILLSIIYPILISAIAHYDLYMKFFRFIKITDKSSRQTAWDDVFTEQKRFILVHLKDDRRVYGWPMYYSNSPEEGFIYLYKPAWLNDENEYIECNTHGILLSNDNVEYVEFMNKNDNKQEVCNEQG